MPIIPLSELTLRHVRTLFAPSEVLLVERLLIDECGDRLPLIGMEATPQSMERIRFATLRLSDGDVGKLRKALKVAREDWRDVLVAAQFANRADAHLSWQPNPRLVTE
jgi:hypothetical protein